MSEVFSIPQARQAVEHLIALHADDAEGSVINAAKHGAVILAWLEKRAELVRAVEELDRRAPYLSCIFRTFPGATIADVRDTFQPPANEDQHDDAAE